MSEEKKRIWTISVWAVEADDKPMYEVPGTAHELPVEAMEVRHNETRLKLRGKVLCDWSGVGLVHEGLVQPVVRAPDGSCWVVMVDARQVGAREPPLTFGHNAAVMVKGRLPAQLGVIVEVSDGPIGVGRRTTVATPSEARRSMRSANARAYCRKRDRHYTELCTMHYDAASRDWELFYDDGRMAMRVTHRELVNEVSPRGMAQRIVQVFGYYASGAWRAAPILETMGVVTPFGDRDHGKEPPRHDDKNWQVGGSFEVPTQPAEPQRLATAHVDLAQVLAEREQLRQQVTSLQDRLDNQRLAGGEGRDPRIALERGIHMANIAAMRRDLDLARVDPDDLSHLIRQVCDVKVVLGNELRRREDAKEAAISAEASAARQAELREKVAAMEARRRKKVAVVHCETEESDEPGPWQPQAVGS